MEEAYENFMIEYMSMAKSVSAKRYQEREAHLLECRAAPSTSHSSLPLPTHSFFPPQWEQFSAFLTQQLSTLNRNVEPIIPGLTQLREGQADHSQQLATLINLFYEILTRLPPAITSARASNPHFSATEATQPPSPISQVVDPIISSASGMETLVCDTHSLEETADATLSSSPFIPPSLSSPPAPISPVPDPLGSTSFPSFIATTEAQSEPPCASSLLPSVHIPTSTEEDVLPSLPSTSAHGEQLRVFAPHPQESAPIDLADATSSPPPFPASSVLELPECVTSSSLDSMIVHHIVASSPSSCPISDIISEVVAFAYSLESPLPPLQTPWLTPWATRQLPHSLQQIRRIHDSRFLPPLYLRSPLPPPLTMNKPILTIFSHGRLP